MLGALYENLQESVCDFAGLSGEGSIQSILKDI